MPGLGSFMSACVIVATLAMYHEMYQTWHRKPRDVRGSREDLEDFLMIIVTVGTNAAMLPVIVCALRKEWHAEAVVGFATFATSSLYHFTESVQSDVWGMNKGKVMKLRTTTHTLLLLLLLPCSSSSSSCC